MLLQLCVHVILPATLVLGSESCMKPVGLENGLIEDARISSSSSFQLESTGSHRARLNNHGGGGAWCPNSLISSSSTEFLEIDVGEEYLLQGVVTQGRFANGLGQEFAEYYRIQYWKEGMSEFKEYTTKDGSSVLQGNTDTNTAVTVMLEPSIRASKVRILPYSTHQRTVCMRVELLGCPLPPATPISNSNRVMFLAILTGILLTLSLLLVSLVLVLVRRRRIIKYPSLGNLSIASSVLQRRVEPVYMEPTISTPNQPAVPRPQYSISVIYSRPHNQIYEVYQSPDSIKGSSTDISYLDEYSVDSSSSSSTPRLPPLPNFESTPDCPPMYVNENELRGLKLSSL